MRLECSAFAQTGFARRSPAASAKPPNSQLSLRGPIFHVRDLIRASRHRRGGVSRRMTAFPRCDIRPAACNSAATPTSSVQIQVAGKSPLYCLLHYSISSPKCHLPSRVPSLYTIRKPGVPATLSSATRSCLSICGPARWRGQAPASSEVLGVDAGTAKLRWRPSTRDLSNFVVAIRSQKCEGHRRRHEASIVRQ